MSTSAAQPAAAAASSSSSSSSASRPQPNVRVKPEPTDDGDLPGPSAQKRQRTDNGAAAAALASAAAYDEGTPSDVYGEPQQMQLLPSFFGLEPYDEVQRRIGEWIRNVSRDHQHIEVGPGRSFVAAS